MKRTVALLLLALCAGTGIAHAEGIGVGAGAFGGYAYPILQDDTGSGFLYGLRVPVRIIPVLTVEPFYASSQLNDETEELGGVEYTRSGFEMTAFGANVMLNSSFYPFAGIGSYELTRPGSEDIKETGWSFGLGYGIPVASSLRLDIRGELDMIVIGDSSRKFGTATAGLTYHFKAE